MLLLSSADLFKIIFAKKFFYENKSPIAKSQVHKVFSYMYEIMCTFMLSEILQVKSEKGATRTYFLCTSSDLENL